MHDYLAATSIYIIYLYPGVVRTLVKIYHATVCDCAMNEVVTIIHVFSIVGVQFSNGSAVFYRECSFLMGVQFSIGSSVFYRECSFL